MPIALGKQKRRAIGLVAALGIAAVGAVPSPALAADEVFDYSFTFVNGVTLEGSSPDKTTFLSDAGGSSVDAPSGMEVHLSCSDDFPGGWGEKDGPDIDVDTAWQIESWQINKLKDGEVDKTCGNVADPNVKPDGNNYRFSFVNGIVIEGVTDGGDVFLPNAGGSSVDAPTGMKVHLSCSDEFPGGWGEKDGPDIDVDTAWQLESYSIMKVKDGEVDKSCGDSFAPPPPVGVPDIDIEKFVNGVDADSPTGPVIALGGTVTFDYTVTNTGEVPLSDVAVVDRTLGPVTCPKTDLAVGEVMECDPMTKIATELGQQFMEAEVTGVALVGAPGVTTPIPADGDGRLYSFTFVNGVTIDGDVDDNTVFLPNAGGTSVENPTGMEVHTSCSDDFPNGWGEKDGPVEGVDTAWRIASFEIIKYKDGSVDKSCADSFFPIEQTVSDDDPVNFLVEVATQPSIDIEKFVNGQDADVAPGPTFELGSTLRFRYRIENTGDETLTDVEIVDDTFGVIRTGLTLAPGDIRNYGQSAVKDTAGPVFMEAEVCGLGEISGIEVCDDDPVNFVVEGSTEPSIDIEKFVNGQDADVAPGPTFELGSRVKFRYRIENTGDETLTDVAIVDDTLGVIKTGLTLAPGEIRNFYRAVVKDTAGPVFMEAEVCGLGEISGIEACDDDPVNFVVEGSTEPSIDIEKFVNGQDADVAPGPTFELGSRVKFRYRIENTGDETLTDVAIVDDTLGVIKTGLTLAPGEIRNFYRAVVKDTAGPVFMEAEVCGLGEISGIEACDDDPVNFVVVDPSGYVNP